MRAARRIHGRAGRSIGALVDAVQHPIAVRITRATALVDRRSQRRIRARVLFVRHAVVIGIRSGRSARLEERDSSGRNEMCRILRTERGVRRRRVDPPSLEPQSETRAHEELDAGASMHAAVRKPVGTRSSEVESGITADQVQRHPARVQRVEQQAPGPDQRLDLRRSRQVLRRLEERFDLETQGWSERVREPHAATRLVREAERLVVFRVGAEQPDFVAPFVLRRQSGATEGEQYQHSRELSHELASASVRLPQLDAPVLRATCRGRIRSNRLRGAVALRDHALGRYALAGEIRLHRSGARLR